MPDLKPCPNCDSKNIEDCYVYVKCNDCLMEGPKTKGGNYDDHADAINLWNGLPRRIKSEIEIDVTFF